MIVLRLAAGGRVAVRAQDVALAQVSAWGSVIVLASDGSRFEVEHRLDDLPGFGLDLWFRGEDVRINPDQICSVWETGGELHYRIAGGIVITQPDVDLHQFLAAIEGARANRAQQRPLDDRARHRDGEPCRAYCFGPRST